MAEGAWLPFPCGSSFQAAPCWAAQTVLGTSMCPGQQRPETEEQEHPEPKIPGNRLEKLPT